MAIRRIHEDGGEAQSNEGRSLRNLFSELGSEISTLFRQEIALARAETQAKIGQARSGATMLVMGGVLAFAGLIVLLMAGVYALGDIMHPAWAALIVGGVAALIGFVVIQSGKSSLKAQNLMPQRTAESLRRDADMLKHEATDMATRRTQ